MNNLFSPITEIAAGIIGLAIIAVLVSNKSQTGNVLGSAGSAFSNIISAATAPVTGNSATPNVNGPSGIGSGSFGNLGGLNMFGGGNLSGGLLG